MLYMYHVFYADAMLGKLARFLRMLGYDTLYRMSEPVLEMLVVAAKEGRVVLSRAKNVCDLANAMGIQSILLTETDIVKQLRQLKEQLNLEFTCPPSPARCSVCNGTLERVSKEKLIQLLPQKTAQQYNEFWRCKKCSKIYWFGSHWKDICTKIDSINS